MSLPSDAVVLTESGLRGPVGLKLGAPLADFAGKFAGIGPDFLAYPLVGTGADEGLRTDLASHLAGASLIAIRAAGTGAVDRTVGSKLLEFLSVEDFGAVGDLTTDDTAAFAHAFAAAQDQGKILRIPAGHYRLTDTIVLTGAVAVLDDGPTNTVIHFDSDVVKPAFKVSCPDNTSISGLWMGGFRLICDVGSAVCDGIALETTATNSAIHHSKVEGLYILNPRRGITVKGVFYKNSISKNTIGGTVTQYGIYADEGFLDITYNDFRLNEITGVGDGAYAWWVHSNHSNWSMNTCDGYVYLSSPGGKCSLLKVETVAASAPPTTAFGAAAVVFNQMQVVDAPGLIGVSNDKATSGFLLLGDGMVVNGTRFDGDQPNNSFLFGGGHCVINGVIMSDAVQKVEDTNTSTNLDKVEFSGCDDITSRSRKYAKGPWTPTFPVGWSTEPTVNSAKYQIIDGVMKLMAVLTGGVSTGDAQVDGSPQAVPSGSGGIAWMSAVETTERLGDGVMVAGSTKIFGFGAADLTSTVWVLRAEFDL